jgi:hypothetical protein
MNRTRQMTSTNRPGRWPAGRTRGDGSMCEPLAFGPWLGSWSWTWHCVSPEPAGGEDSGQWGQTWRACSPQRPETPAGLPGVGPGCLQLDTQTLLFGADTDPVMAGSWTARSDARPWYWAIPQTVPYARRNSPVRRHSQVFRVSIRPDHNELRQRHRRHPTPSA